MIGSGIFIVSADIAHQVQSPGTASRRLARFGRDDADRRAQLRRTRRCHASRRRAIRLPARIPRPALGLSLRLDDAARHSNRHDRSRRDRIREIHRCHDAVVLAHGLDPENSAPSVRGISGSAISAPTMSASIARTCSPSCPSSSSPGLIRAASDSARSCRIFSRLRKSAPSPFWSLLGILVFH